MQWKFRYYLDLAGNLTGLELRASESDEQAWSTNFDHKVLACHDETTRVFLGFHSKRWTTF